jgi:tetratricopeptide (TPR) repeat protein
MNGRKLAMLACVAASCAGCVTETKRVDVSSENLAKVQGVKETQYPKREALPATWVSVGRMNESRASDPKTSPLEANACRDEARKAYQKAIELDVHCLEAHICLANLYLKQDDPERAAAVYQKAVQQNPQAAALWYELGVIHLKNRKDVAQALVCLGKAHGLQQKDHFAKQYGYCLAFAGKGDEAVKVLASVESRAEANYDVARMMAFLKQPELSQKYLAVTLAERPTHQGAQELQAALLYGRPDAPAVAGAMTDANFRPVSLSGPVTP